jgi:hypothetical protein
MFRARSRTILRRTAGLNLELKAKAQEKGKVVSQDFALFLPFADIQIRIRAANRCIVRIIDRGNVYRVQLAFRRLLATKPLFSFC